MLISIPACPRGARKARFTSTSPSPRTALRPGASVPSSPWSRRGSETCRGWGTGTRPGVCSPPPRPPARAPRYLPLGGLAGLRRGGHGLLLPAAPPRPRRERKPRQPRPRAPAAILGNVSASPQWPRRAVAWAAWPSPLFKPTGDAFSTRGSPQPGGRGRERRTAREIPLRQDPRRGGGGTASWRLEPAPLPAPAPSIRPNRHF